MSKLTYKLSFVFLLGMMLATLILLMQKPWEVGASVTVGNSYLSTTTGQSAGTLADLTNLCPPRSGQTQMTGTLGSIVVTGPNIGEILAYNASSTDINQRGFNNTPAATSSLLLAHVPSGRTYSNATTSPNTYQYDASFQNGLVIDFLGTAPTSTITYRCGS